MRKSIKTILAALALATPLALTSCEGTLDDVLGEWSRPTPGNNTNTTPTASDKYIVYTAAGVSSPETIPSNATEWNFTSGEVPAGIYTVSSNFNSTGLLKLMGDVKIILKDNVTLTVDNGIFWDLATNAGTLTIYAQSEGDIKGHLVVNNATPQDVGGGAPEAVGIHVLSLTIHGGLIDTSASSSTGVGVGSYYGVETQNDFTIYAGELNANGQYGGSGIENNGTSVINGGKVTANGGNADGTVSTYGGTGLSTAATLTINGGTVIAKGGTGTTANGGNGVNCSVDITNCTLFRAVGGSGSGDGDGFSTAGTQTITIPTTHKYSINGSFVANGTGAAITPMANATLEVEPK